MNKEMFFDDMQLNELIHVLSEKEVRLKLQLIKELTSTDNHHMLALKNELTLVREIKAILTEVKNL